MAHAKKHAALQHDRMAATALAHGTGAFAAHADSRLLQLALQLLPSSFAPSPVADTLVDRCGQHKPTGSVLGSHTELDYNLPGVVEYNDQKGLQGAAQQQLGMQRPLLAALPLDSYSMMTSRQWRQVLIALKLWISACWLPSWY